MTREEAIRRIEEHMIHHHMREYPHIFIGEALDMAISALRDQRVRDATKTSSWINVNDRLPKTCKDVLTCRRNGHVEMNWLMLVDGWYKDAPELNPVTHWMPLPEPPKEEI